VEAVRRVLVIHEHQYATALSVRIDVRSVEDFLPISASAARNESSDVLWLDAQEISYISGADD